MNQANALRLSRIILALLAALLVGGQAAAAPSSVIRPLTPVVVFPAFHFTTLKVTVTSQTVAPDCPSSGSFEYWYPNPTPSATFNQVCQDKLLTMRYNPDPTLPMAKRFVNQAGVSVAIMNYSKTESAPAYEALYDKLESAGYTRNLNIRVAGYDSRLTPDIGVFLSNTKKLIERTYYDNGSTPVHLVGHSNGPLYAQYLLTHTTAAWKKQFIHGFTPIAGNMPGQGLFYPVYFTGLNIIDFHLPADPANALSSAKMYLTHPSSYMSSADPAIFDDDMVVVENLASGKSYTPYANIKLFYDAGLPQAAHLAAYYTGFVKFADPASFPNVDVYAEKGSGIPTAVGMKLPNLSLGYVVNDTTEFFLRDGDGNQEDITNDAIQAWDAMACHRFELTDNPGVGHFELPDNATVLNRLLTNLGRTRSAC